MYEYCEHYREMYDLRETWGSMKCRKEGILGRPKTCDGCPLTKPINSEQMVDPNG